MEDGSHPAEGDTNAAAGTLGDLGPGGSQQTLDFTPSEVGRCGLGKDASQRPSVTAVHPAMISYSDIIYSVGSNLTRPVILGYPGNDTSTWPSGP
jgi:hypothetical protein